MAVNITSIENATRPVKEGPLKAPYNAANDAIKSHFIAIHNDSDDPTRRVEPLSTIQTAQAVVIGNFAANEALKQERKLETQAAIEEILNAPEGKNIVSDMVYKGVLRAFKEQGKEMNN